MSKDSLDINYLINLYNGHQAVAERSIPYQIRQIHVKTNLDSKIVEWINRGEDVILTGNPGDGKTHLLRYLDPALPPNVEREMDASQKQPEDILLSWRRCRKKGCRYIIAINHAPLRNLAEVAAKDQMFKSLKDMILPTKPSLSAIDNFIVYSEEQVTPFINNASNNLKIKIIDLSQREILTKEIIQNLLKKLCPIAASASCHLGLNEQCKRCPLHDNANALANPKIQENLSFLLSLVARRGFHATMRDLVGLLAYILTGGITCEDLWKKTPAGDLPNYKNFEYYNLLFQGRNPLFDAVRQTFDPGQYSDPETDLKLWHGTLTNGWSISSSNEGQLPITILDDLRTAKRRYFFEHSEQVEEKYRRMVTGISQEFNDLLTSDDPISPVYDLVEKINLFYAPLSKSKTGNYRDRLYLWNQHRYSKGGQLPGYVAMRSISSDMLRVYHPKLNPIYEQALDVRQDHVLLALANWLPGDPALRVDWEMFKSLCDAKQGMTIEVQPYPILRRLDLFLRSLGSIAGNWLSVETVIWGDYRRRASITIQVDRRKSTYLA